MSASPSADLDEAIALLRSDVFGMQLVHEESNEDQGVREAMLAVGDSGSYVQLLAPLTADSPIGKFLEHSGPGPAAGGVPRRTTSTAVATRCASAGCRLLYDEPRRGTAGARINFIHPKDAGGVLRRTRRNQPDARVHRPRPSAHGGRRATRFSTPSSPVDATADDFASLAVPDHYTGALLRQEDETMFDGLPTRDRDPRKSLRIEDVPVPELGPGEALIAVMASSINYNTVWSSIFEPVSTFGFLRRYGRTSPLGQAPRPAVPRHRLGPVRRRAAHRARRARRGSPGKKSSPTASRSSSRAPSGTTTRCSTPSSESGGSRPTSAASRSSPWSRPTSCSTSPST